MVIDRARATEVFGEFVKSARGPEFPPNNHFH